MNIGFLTDTISSTSTGIGTYAKSIIDQIIQDDKNTFYYIDNKKNPLKDGKKLFIKNPFPFIKSYLWHNYLPFVKELEIIDVIFNFSAIPHVFPFKQKELFFVYDISWYLFPQFHKKGRVLYYKLLCQLSLHNAHAIIVDSFHTKNDIIKRFHINSEKIFVIYPTIEKVKKEAPISTLKNMKYILYIGTLEPRKNILSILYAFKKLKDKTTFPHKLILCGKKGWMYENIFSTIKKLGLEKDIIYLGYITNEEKRYLYTHATCFVFPSFYEGFGIPVLEAMTYGCPVITSMVSSLPEVAGNACLLVEPEDTRSIADAMEKLLKNDSLRKTLIQKGYQQVKNLDNKKQIQDFLLNLKNNK